MHDIGVCTVTNESSERGEAHTLEELDRQGNRRKGRSRAAQIARLRQQAAQGASVDDLSSLLTDSENTITGDMGMAPHPPSELFKEQVVYLRGHHLYRL